MQLVSPPCWLRNILSDSLVWQIETTKKEIFLTFDDGPTQELTPWILSTLNDFNAKATFFCVGNNISKHPDIYKQMLAEGHLVGNHTYQHEQGLKTSTPDYIKSIMQCDALIKSPLFRPPHGQIKPQQIRVLKQQFKIIMWSVLTYDFDQTITPEQCFENAIKKTKAGSIVVFHDNTKAQENLQFALPKFLKHFTDKGFNFTVLK